MEVEVAISEQTSVNLVAAARDPRHGPYACRLPISQIQRLIQIRDFLEILLPEEWVAEALHAYGITPSQPLDSQHRCNVGL